MKPTLTNALALAPVALIALAFWALAPGLTGGFLFDDHVNLSALGEFGGIRNAQTLALYLTSALGDPFGRPLSLLSFLVDANNWPASAKPFLHTNILVHLINGLLLTLVLIRLGRSQEREPFHVELAAILGAGIWLLHPLFLSTTLYIVQREAMLTATFTLLGFLAWLSGRRRLEAGDIASGYTWLFIGAIACSAAATLCKANGVLLPLLLLVAEVTLLARSPLQSRVQFVNARRILLGVPIATVFILIAWTLPQSIDVAGTNRPWTLAQRLLTEPRVLFDYIQNLAFPRPISRGVFHDDFLISTDWFHPWSTLPALIGIVLCIAAGWRRRKRWPACAFAILFFFGGHVLESSVVPLELYFEHRNYLPSMMAFWPLALWLTQPRWPLQGVRLATGLLIVVGLAFNLHSGAQIWGQPERLAYAWAARSPDSPRAQAYAAQYEIAAGANASAERRLTQALASHPYETQLVFNLVNAQCELGEVSPESIALAQRAANHDAKAAALDFSWLIATIERASSGNCKGLDLHAVERLLEAARSNVHFANAPGRQQDFDHIQGRIELARHNPESALVAFNRAQAILPRPAIALQQAALLGAAGRADLGLQHLTAYLSAHPLQAAHFGLSPASLHTWLLNHYSYWRDEFARMHDILASESIRS